MTPEMLDEKRYREYLAYQRAELAIDFGGVAVMSMVTLGVTEPSHIEFQSSPETFQPTERQTRLLGQVPLAQLTIGEHAGSPFDEPDRVLLGQAA